MKRLVKQALSMMALGLQRSPLWTRPGCWRRAATCATSRQELTKTSTGRGLGPTEWAVADRQRSRQANVFPLIYRRLGPGVKVVFRVFAAAAWNLRNRRTRGPGVTLVATVLNVLSSALMLLESADGALVVAVVGTSLSGSRSLLCCCPAT